MKQLIHIIILSTIFLVGCQKDSLQESNYEEAPIYLSAITEGNITRVPYEETTPNQTPEGILHAAIWASSDKDSFLNSGKNGKTDGTTDGVVAIHTSANFVSGNPQLLADAVYPNNNQDVYFVGLHPQNNWSVNSNGTMASFTFNGNEDVMFAPRATGTYDKDNIVDLTFYHLLTLLKIRMYAENQETEIAWGKIKSIKISSKNKVSIDIVNEYDYTNHSKITYFPEGDSFEWLPLYKKGSDNILATEEKPYSLLYLPENGTPKNIEEVAYVLCSPVIAKGKVKEYEGDKEISKEVPEYTLDIVTEHRHVQLPIDLKKNTNDYFEGSTRAKCFTLNLTFKMGNTIVVTANVDDWDFGGTGNIELK